MSTAKVNWFGFKWLNYSFLTTIHVNMFYFQKSSKQSNYNIAAKCLYNSEFQSEDNVSWKYRTRFLSPPLLSGPFWWVPLPPNPPRQKLLGLVAYHSRTKFLFEILCQFGFTDNSSTVIRRVTTRTMTLEIMKSIFFLDIWWILKWKN